MQLRWSPRAERDFAHIHTWISVDNPEAADRQCDLIAHSLRQIVRFPQSGRKARPRHVRELPVPGTPYVVRYRIVGEYVDLLTIKHGAQL